MDEDDEEWIDPFGEAWEQLVVVGLVPNPINGMASIGGPHDLRNSGPERMRLEFRDAPTEVQLAAIQAAMGDVAYELAHVTTTPDRKLVLDDGTVIGGWLTDEDIDRRT